jgi:hypothetical protein
MLLVRVLGQLFDALVDLVGGGVSVSKSEGSKVFRGRGEAPISGTES